MKPLDTLREDLHRILAAEEYQIYTREPNNILHDLLVSLKNWLHQILKNLFPHIDVGKKTAEWLSYGIAALGVLLLLLLLYLLLSRFVWQGHLNLKKVNIQKAQPLTAQRHLAEAHRLAEDGYYSPALRHLFLGFLLSLNQNQWIEAKAWKTNWEYYAELKSSAPQLASSFYTLALKFDEAMYGGRPIVRDEYWLYHNELKKWIHEEDTR